jgi:hypothetical protein
MARVLETDITGPRAVRIIISINSSLIPKTPRIEGENIKYSEKISIPKPIS